MTPDVGPLIRLRSTIRSLLSGAEKYESETGAVLVTAYQASRSETQGLVGDAMADELDRVAPEPSFGGTETWQDKIDFNKAKLALNQLAGWIDGLVEQAQYTARLAAEAEAYAEARLKAEQGMGFKQRRGKP